MKITIQVFSDYTCPFCRLGLVALEQATANTESEIVWRAFLLRDAEPESATAAPPLADWMQQAWREVVAPMATQLGVTLHQPSRLPFTRRAHEAAAWARAQGRFADYHRTLFDAYFQEDLDIGSVTVLQQLAWRIGLDAAALGAALADRALADDVAEDLLIGQTYGVRSVPAFVIGGQIFSGVQESMTLRRAIETAQAGRPVLQAVPPAPALVTLQGKPSQSK